MTQAGAPTRQDGRSPEALAMMQIAGVDLFADVSGAFVCTRDRVLIVSDLHLEKGASYARRGVFLPPYDTIATLARLGALVARFAPRLVIALGDSFHDVEAARRLAPSSRDALLALQAGRDWIWVLGNHDPDVPRALGGERHGAFVHRGLTFRHEPSGATGEIAGHLHPKARVSVRGRALDRRCFVSDGERAVMPAFGAYAGGLNIRDKAFAMVFPTRAFTAHLLGDHRLHAIDAGRCL